MSNSASRQCNCWRPTLKPLATRVVQNLCWDQVFKANKKRFGVEHFTTHEAAANLAYVYQSQNRHAEAIELLQPTYNVLSKIDPLHASSLKAAVRLARLHTLAGNNDQARQLYQEAANDLARLFGENHPNTLTAKHGLALAQTSLGKLPAARKILEEVFYQQEIQLGSEHPSTLSTLHNLARANAALGDRDIAHQLYKSELAVHKKKWGLQDDRTREALSSLAFFHLDEAKFGLAIPYYQSLLESFPRREVQLIDRRRVTTQAMLGLCHMKTKQFESAREILKSAQQDCQLFFPEDWLLPVVTGLLGEVELRAGERLDAEVALIRSYEQLINQERELPWRWKPLGLRAATRRLAEFYETSETDLASAAGQRVLDGIPAALRKGFCKEQEQE